MRYLKVRGRPGVLVANPHAIGADPPRYAGQKRKPNAAQIREHNDRYEPIEEILRDEPSLRNAADNGEIEIVAVGNGNDVASVVWVAPATGKDS